MAFLAFYLGVGKKMKEPFVKHEEPLLTDLCSCTDVRQAVDTTGNQLYAVCQKVCREPHYGHSAKNLFAECLEPNTRQTRGTRHNPYLPSAGARQINGTRQNMDMPSASERAHGKAGARASHARRPSHPFVLPSASRLALGKDPLPSGALPSALC